MRVELTTFGYWFRFLGLRTNALPLRHTDQKTAQLSGQAVVCSHECLCVITALVLRPTCGQHAAVCGFRMECFECAIEDAVQTASYLIVRCMGVGPCVRKFAAKLCVGHCVGSAIVFHDALFLYV